MSRTNTRAVRLAVFAAFLIAIGLLLAKTSSMSTFVAPNLPGGTSEESKAPAAQPDAGKDAGNDAAAPPAPPAASASDSDSVSEAPQPQSPATPNGKIPSEAMEQFPNGVPDNYERAAATFVTLARNTDLYSLMDSIRVVEDRFNHKFKYDWVFLNDDDFTDEFKDATSALVSGKTFYGKIPKEQWSFPEWIDLDRAARAREEMREKKVIYGDSVPYRHMCRYESGFFFRHPLMDKYKYYWRVEPGIKLYCDINYDAFKFMEVNDYKYGFTISLKEYYETIPTLWDTTKQFMEKHPEYLPEDNMLDFVSDDNGSSYNLCHFWSNFEIGSLDFLRSKAYLDYFEHLDKAGGFFYERWGDAPVHSIAASLFLHREQIHFFDDVGYFHVPFHNCPIDSVFRLQHKCVCNPGDDFTWRGYSCTGKFFSINNLPKPKGWENYA